MKAAGALSVNYGSLKNNKIFLLSSDGLIISELMSYQFDCLSTIVCLISSTMQ